MSELNVLYLVEIFIEVFCHFLREVILLLRKVICLLLREVICLLLLEKVSEENLQLEVEYHEDNKFNVRIEGTVPSCNMLRGHLSFVAREYQQAELP